MNAVEQSAANSTAGRSASIAAFTLGIIACLCVVGLVGLIMRGKGIETQYSGSYGSNGSHNVQAAITVVATLLTVSAVGATISGGLAYGYASTAQHNLQKLVPPSAKPLKPVLSA